MDMSFRKWMELFWLEPPKEDPTKVAPGSFADYQGKEQRNPTNPDGQLPPVQRRIKKKKL